MSLLRLADALQEYYLDQFIPVVILFTDGPLRAKLDARGVEVHVLELDRRVATTARGELGRLTPAKLVDGVRAAVFVWRLRTLLRRLDVHLVTTNSLKADLLGGIASRLARLPVVWYVRDRIADGYLPRRTARVVRRAARLIPQHVIANSKATVETLGEMPAGRASVGYPGLPTSLLKTAPGGSAGQSAVGLIGRISPTKGQDVFLRAAAQVAKDHPSARFRVIGSALFNEREFETEVRAMPADLGIAEQVSFTGFVDDVSAELRSLRAFVHASPVPEPFGQAVIEAMAAGIPVIATRAGGVVEILDGRSGDYGVLVEPGDDKCLADAIRWVLDHPQESNDMAARAYRRVASTFTIQHTARHLTEVWYRTLDAR
jgi:glycosyltransferase involved in cell wall biosynthesis